MNNTGVQMEYEKAIDYIFGMIKNGDLTVGSKLPTELVSDAGDSMSGNPSL